MIHENLSTLPDAVLVRHCPVLYLHHQDAYRPVSVEWFIERAELRYYRVAVTGGGELGEQVPGGVETLLAAGQVTQEKLIEVQDAAQARGQNPDNLSLTVAPVHYAGGRACDTCDVPIYVHAKLVVDECGEPEAYEINYITFYAFNGHYDLPAGLPVFRHGHHVGDWEHMTVRLDAASLELQGVWYNAHRNIEGEWCPAARVPRSPCGRILGYVAINGHGIYPNNGTIPRLFFVANDRTSNKGPVWNPSRIVRLCGLAHGSGCPVVYSRGCSLPCASARTLAHRPSTPQAGGTAGGPSAPHLCPDERHGEGALAGALLPGPRSTGELELLPMASGEGAGAAASAAGQSTAVAAGAAGPGGVDAEGRVAGAAAACAIPEGGKHPEEEAATGAAAAPAGASAHSAAQSSRGGGGFPLPVVVHDTSLWQLYKGRWGTVVSATQQGWFLGPEPPVSRGLIRRLFLPCAAGVDRLPRPRPPLTGTVGTAIDGFLKSVKAMTLTPERGSTDREG